MPSTEVEAFRRMQDQGEITTGNELFDEVATDEDLKRHLELRDRANRHRRRARRQEERKERHMKRVLYKRSEEYRNRMDRLRKEAAPDFRVVQIEETKHWLDPEIVQDAGRIWGVWIFDAGRGVHACSMHASYELFRLDFTTLEPISEETEDKIRRSQWEKEVDYVSVSAIDTDNFDLCEPVHESPFFKDWVERWNKIVQQKQTLSKWKGYDDPEEREYEKFIDKRFEFTANPFWEEPPSHFLDENLRYQTLDTDD